MGVERVANLLHVITVWKDVEAAGIATVAEANEGDVATTVVAVEVVLLAMASTRGRDRPELADTAETTIPAAAATSTGGEIKNNFEKNCASASPTTHVYHDTPSTIATVYSFSVPQRDFSSAYTL